MTADPLWGPQGRSDAAQDQESLEIFLKYTSPGKRQAATEGRPYQVDIELTSQCHAGCKYCLAGSESSRTTYLETGRMLRFLEEMAELGMQQAMWAGGDPVLHPDFWCLVDKATEVGLRNVIFTSGMISKALAKRFVEHPNVGMVGFNFETIDQGVFDELHHNPKVLQAKIEGYGNLLEAGFPRSRILPIPTLSRPMAQRIEETLDFVVDEMGASNLGFLVYKPYGLACGQQHWEPSLSDVRRVFEYRAKKLGNHWLRIATMECSKLYCQAKFSLTCDGGVSPCSQMSRDLVVANIYELSLQEIFEKHGDTLLFRTLKLKGKCADCENNDVCWGCRALAYHYLGDMEASDPKCWMNPEAKERYLSPNALP